jgi:hypothetical protein
MVRVMGDLDAIMLGLEWAASTGELPGLALTARKPV